MITVTTSRSVDGKCSVDITSATAPPATRATTVMIVMSRTKAIARVAIPM